MNIKDELHCVALGHPSEGSRYFIFNAEDDVDARAIAKEFANSWLDEGWHMIGFGPAIDYCDGNILEICTF